MTSAELHADLADSRKALLAPLAGLSEEQFRFAPPDGRWSIAAHLAHFLRVERAVGEGVAGAGLQPRQMASAGASNDGDEGLAQRLAVPQIIHGLQASRRALEALLVGDDVPRRQLHHQRLGVLTVADLLHSHADHEREHAQQISALVDQARTARRVIIPLAENAQGLLA